MKPVILNHSLNKTALWNGCMLASIAHAIMVAHDPELAYEHSWDGQNYNVVDSSGGRGTVTFDDNYIVGAFRVEGVSRPDRPAAVDFFAGAPKEVLELAKEETLAYLLEEDEDGTVSPLITTAFWGDRGTLSSADSIVRFVRYGGYLLEEQFMDTEAAIEAWREYYEMNEAQVQLLTSLYARKIQHPEDPIALTRREIDMIGSDNPEGLSESRTSFAEIGIAWEE